MSKNTENTVTAPKTVKASKAIDPQKEKANLQKEMEELKAKLAGYEVARVALIAKEKEVNEAARVDLENKMQEFSAKVGKDLATLGRCFSSLAKNGHLKGDSDSTVGGPRKARVVLTDEQKTAVVNELRAMQSAKAGIIAHCKTIESRDGMPGFQTIYNWATEAGIQNAVATVAK